MPLRSSNNPRTDIVLLNALKPVLPPNTLLAQLSTSGTGLERIYIQQKYQMSLGDFPALLLTCGQQNYTYASYGRQGTVTANVFYYDRWDQQNSTIDDILGNIATDLNRMQANVEENDSVIMSNTPMITGIPSIGLSPYEGSIEASSITGISLVFRLMTLQFTILPYDF